MVAGQGTDYLFFFSTPEVQLLVVCAGQKIQIKGQNVHCHCPRRSIKVATYGQTRTEIVQEICPGGKPLEVWPSGTRRNRLAGKSDSNLPTPNPKPLTPQPMNMKKVKCLVGAACGAIALMNLGLQAQTLPITAGLQLWLKADAGVTTNSSGQVTAWADQSVLGNNATQGTVANAPTLAPNSLNGHSTLRFISPQYMEVPNANGIDNLLNDVTVVTVANYDNLAGYRGVVSKCTGGVGSPFDFWSNASANAGRTSFYLGNGTATAATLSTIAPPTGVYNVLSFRWKNGISDQFLNDFNVGNAVNTTATVNGATNLRIGRRQDGTVQLVGNLAELLIYKPSLSDSDLYNVVTNYLQPKYALAFDLAPTIAITSPTNGASAVSGVAFPVTMSVSDADGYVASVSVYGNGVLLGTATATTTNSSFQLMVSALGQGPLALTAIATDNYGHPTTSVPVGVNITSAYPTVPLTTGLKVWLAADAGITTNLSGAVTNWTDQSASGNNATQSIDETLAPVLVPNAINGKPALHFNGTNMFLEVSDDGTSFLTNDFTTFAVARFVGSYPALRQHVWSKCSTNGWAGPVDWWLNPGTGVPFGYRGDGVFFAGTGSGPNGPVLGQFSELGMTVTGSNGVMAHHLGFADNGSSIALTNTANAGPMRIGRRLDGGTQLNGDIAEILIYNQALSSIDRSNVVGYLSSKYNLVKATYASAPPVLSVISPVNGSTSAAPTTATFAVNASSAQGLITRVTLSANGATFATLTTPPYQVSLDLLTPGTVTFTAVAQDNWGFQTTTSIVTTVTGAASTPPVTTGLRVWLAADAGVTTDTTGAVTSWVDQSLNGNNAAPPAGATAPVLVPNVQNGKPVLRFAGGNPGQYLEVPTDTSFTAGDISTFALAKFNNFTGTPAYRTIWTKTANNNLAAPDDWYFAATTGAANLLRGAGAAGTYGGVTGGNVPAGLFALVGFKASGQAITHYLGYNVNGSGNIIQTPFDAGFPLRIGRRDDGGIQMNGDISEILIYDHAVSESDRLQIANYLYNKWGITVVKLHNVPPTITLTSPTNGTPISAPGVLSVIANATDPDSPINQVNFLANGTVVATRTAPPYQIPLQVLTPGPLTLTAQAVDFWGAIGTSAPVVVTVTGSGPARPPTTGAVLWLKADAGVTTNADGTVASWADQSGNTNNAMADLVYGFPTPFLIADVTGKPVLNYDGAIRYLEVVSSPSLALTNDLSIFFSGSIDDFASVRSICGKTQIAQPHPFDYNVNVSGLAQLSRGDTRGTSTVVSSGPLSASNNVVAGVTLSGSFATHYLQGFANGTGSMGYGTIDDGFDLLIGSRDARDIYFKGNLRELLIYNRALVGSDLQAINAYLAGRSGIATSQLSTQPPTVAVAKTGANTMQLSWLPGYAGFILEGRTNVASGAWTPVATNPPNNQVSITATNVARFFRLRSQ
jgi:hypothetical protein